MRGGDNRSGELFSYVDLEARVRGDHPLRPIRIIVNEALSVLEREFAALYSPIGRPSIPPEKLLRALLLHAFYSIRSERLLMERLEYDLLFRWFVGIGVDDVAWDHSVFSKNRDRLLRPNALHRGPGFDQRAIDREVIAAAKFLAAVLAQPKVKKLLSRTASARRRAQCRSGLPWPETLERYPCFDRRSGHPRGKAWVITR